MPAASCRWPCRMFPAGWALALAIHVLWANLLPAQMKDEKVAEMLLGSARLAHNEKNFPFAAARFREFLARFGNHKEAPAARYGLALALLDGPERDYQGALEPLQNLAGNKALPEFPSVLYHLGLAQRGLGLKSLALATAKPPEAPQHRAQANQRFEEAAKQFAAAVPAFGERVKAVDPAAPELPRDLEWSARARCDQAEMLLRLNRARDALTAVIPLVQDKTYLKSRYYTEGLYYHGFSSFLLKDYHAAGRSLSQLAPYTNPVFGTHARYLVARVHHLDNERQEAQAGYQGVLTDHENQKKAAQEALKQPDRYKNDPEEKARLEALVKGPPPDHCARAALFLGVLQYEDGKFGEALARFTAFLQQSPTSPLAAEVQLRQGFCQVQLKQFPEALKTLQPLADKEPRLADQCLFWIGKAQAGAADPANPPAHEQAVKTALDTLRKAADRANQLAGTDPGARERRGEILLELAEAQQSIKQYREAANTYGQVQNEKLLPARDEETVQRQAVALQLAGAYNESDAVCIRFRDSYPKSPLLPAVLFRHAENAYFSLLAAEKLPNPPDRARETARWNDEAVKRYQVVVDRFPEFPHVQLARYGLALCYYRKGDLEKAREKLESIPAAERGGDLALVSYQLADCLIRLAPTRADDALSAGKLGEQLKSAIDYLESFLAALPASPQAPDALLKLGYCHGRLASLQAQEPEQARALAAARAAYEQILQRFPQHELQPQAVFERAKCLSLAKDVNGAVNELRRFTADPLQKAPVAPLALLYLATLLRGQNKPAEAADLLGKCRQQQEPALRGDPARASWVPLLLYHHGVALREAGKGAEARAVFQVLVQQFPDRPEAADGALRWGQSLKDDGQAKIAQGTKKLQAPNLKPEEIAAARKEVDEGVQELRNAVQHLVGQAEQLRQKQPASEARSRMLYEAAWGSRLVGAHEAQSARAKMERELWQKQKDEVAKKTPPGFPPPFVPLPDVPPGAVPVQPGEAQARTQYESLIASFPDLPLTVDARFELAELLCDRGLHDAAIKLLKDALDKEPGPELTDRVRVRLGACLLAQYAAQNNAPPPPANNKPPDPKSDPKATAQAALTYLQPVANNTKSPLVAQATYRVGECYLLLGDPAEAAKRLAVFRDQGPFQNVPGVTDRALLRLGHALASLKQWDQSRQALEQLVSRFGGSPWVHEARYGIGWAWQSTGQYENAVNAYNQVTNAVATELAARAQLNVGLCRHAQKRFAEAGTAFLVVPFTYDYPDLSALALLEAARSLADNKQPEQAVKILERVLRDHANTQAAEAARKRLEEIKKI